MSSRLPISLARRTKHQLRLVPARRITNQSTPRSPEPTDPRPPWLFTASSVLRVLCVPVILGYAVFVHDFGFEEDKEHVFSPARRWARRQKEAFWTLSSDEEQLVASSRLSPQTESPSPGTSNGNSPS